MWAAVDALRTLLRDRLAAARGLTQPTQLDDLEALACCSFMVRVSLANPTPNPTP